MASASQTLMEIYDALYDRYGPQGWWPAQSPFEVIVGALLTQNTGWKNVEKAIANLKRERLLDPLALRRTSRERLADVIRPAGYYNVKAARLHDLLEVLVDEYGADTQAFLSGNVETLRQRLLSIRGVGLETADSIILYAAGEPTFVVDRYTCRVAARHGLVFEDAAWHELKGLFEDNLPSDAALFNEYHALLVKVGKEHCRPAARCGGCPLERFAHTVE